MVGARVSIFDCTFFVDAFLRHAHPPVVYHVAHCTIYCPSYTIQVYLETFAADKETFRTLVESYRLRYTGNDTLRNAVARDSIRAPTGSAQSQGEDPLLAAATLEETPATEDPTYDDLFGSFHDPLKYSGAAPTESYLQHVWRIWFKDLSLQTPVNLPWTREDYQRRVLHLWNSSTPPPQPPALAIDVATLCAPIPLAPLALPHQWTQVSSSRLGDSTLRPQMPVVQPPPHLDADAAREQHRGLLHLASSSSSSSSTSIKTSRYHVLEAAGKCMRLLGMEPFPSPKVRN